jgi:hypothetical protein
MCGDSLQVEQSLFQEIEGGVIPTSPLQLKIERVNQATAQWAYKKWHYFGQKGFLSTYNFGVYFEGVCVGAISYGITNARNIKGLFTAQTQLEYMELTRFALSEVCPKNSESRVIAITLKMLRKLNPKLKGVITYADTAYGHTGTIYKASNFKYLGLTAQKTDLFVGDKQVGKLKGVKYSEIKGEWRKRSRKYLFVYIF